MKARGNQGRQRLFARVLVGDRIQFGRQPFFGRCQFDVHFIVQHGSSVQFQKDQPQRPDIDFFVGSGLTRSGHFGCHCAGANKRGGLLGKEATAVATAQATAAEKQRRRRQQQQVRQRNTHCNIPCRLATFPTVGQNAANEDHVPSTCCLVGSTVPIVSIVVLRVWPCR